MHSQSHPALILFLPGVCTERWHDSLFFSYGRLDWLWLLDIMSELISLDWRNSRPLYLWFMIFILQFILILNRKSIPTGFNLTNTDTVNPTWKDLLWKYHPVWENHFCIGENVLLSLESMYTQPGKKGHLHEKTTFSWYQGCFFQTGFCVYWINNLSDFI